MDIKLYWRTVREREKELRDAFGETVFVSTIECADTGTPGGRVSVCAPLVAAKLAIAKSHRIATEQEISVWQEAQIREGERIAAHGRRMAYVNQDQAERSKNGRAYQL